ncbi:MAG: RDD family protein [Acidimicrobiales bacterium]
MNTPPPAARAIARVIDLGIVAVPVALISALTGGLGQGLVIAALLGAYLYETLMISTTGTTVGKRRMGLRVVDHDTGAKPPTSKAGTRFLSVVAIAALVHLVIPVGPAVAVFIWGSAVVTPDGRGLPDRAANTQVVAA